ncbi:MAG TPA: hemolysin family protein [Candidatus Acidoferrales bacterium]|nr:hemolysin family protein [Candidatus Acidoferrales bacterium]
MAFLQLFGVLAIVGVNAFFAAAEFSLVAVRTSRVRQLIEQGDARARIVESLMSDMGRVISGVQVGITLASLALGYIGEITLSRMIRPAVAGIPGHWAAIAAHGIALVVAFGLLTVMEVILGELVPKSVSLARAERVALIIARPFSWFLHAFRWAIDLLDGIAEKIVRGLGVPALQSHTVVHSAEELQVLIEQARERGLLQASEMQFIRGMMELAQVQVRELMVPRPDIHALPVEASLEDAMKMFATTQRSRLPVYELTLDHAAGFVHIKDLIWPLLEKVNPTESSTPAEFNLRRYIREILIVPETKPASELLVEFRVRRTEIAMVVDEFGSILGLITLEDILEQMVGEIHDEFDVVERPVRLPDGSLVFDAALKVRDLEAQYGITLPDDSSYETIGGFVLSRLGFLPRGGESFEAYGLLFTVMDMDRRRVSRVKIKSLDARATAASMGIESQLPATSAAKSATQSASSSPPSSRKRVGS